MPDATKDVPRERSESPGPARAARKIGHWEHPEEMGHRVRLLCQTFYPGLPATEVWHAIAGHVAAEGLGIDEVFGPEGTIYVLDTASWLKLVEGNPDSVVSERLLTAISIAMGGGDYLLSDDPGTIDRAEAIFEFIQSQNEAGTRSLLFSSLGPGAPAHAYRTAAAQTRASATDGLQG